MLVNRVGWPRFILWHNQSHTGRGGGNLDAATKSAAVPADFELPILGAIAADLRKQSGAKGAQGAKGGGLRGFEPCLYLRKCNMKKNPVPFGPIECHSLPAISVLGS